MNYEFLAKEWRNRTPLFYYYSFREITGKINKKCSTEFENLSMKIASPISNKHNNTRCLQERIFTAKQTK
jgi:hypothetical protein